MHKVQKQRSDLTQNIQIGQIGNFHLAWLPSTSRRKSFAQLLGKWHSYGDLHQYTCRVGAVEKGGERKGGIRTEGDGCRAPGIHLPLIHELSHELSLFTRLSSNVHGVVMYALASERNTRILSPRILESLHCAAFSVTTQYVRAGTQPLLTWMLDRIWLQV